MTFGRTQFDTHKLETQIRDVLYHFPRISVAILFGSLSTGRARAESDLDLAVSAQSPLTSDEKIAIINQLALEIGRPVDLIDLHVVSEPLLGQILRHGRRLAGDNHHYGELISRHLFNQADFMPYRARILAERREKWINRSSNKN